jgi:hypothetical protein
MTAFKRAGYRSTKKDKVQNKINKNPIPNNGGACV